MIAIRCVAKRVTGPIPRALDCVGRPGTAIALVPQFIHSPTPRRVVISEPGADFIRAAIDHPPLLFAAAVVAVFVKGAITLFIPSLCHAASS